MTPLLPATVDSVKRLVADRAGRSNEVVELNRANYLMHLWLAGSHNHGADVVDFYERVASAAPGSYGVLYLHDDERSVGDRNK